MSENDFRPVDNSKVLRELRQCRDRLPLGRGIEKSGAATRAVTPAELQKVVDKLVAVLGDDFGEVRKEVDRLQKEIDSLQLRFNALQMAHDTNARELGFHVKHFGYRGVWKEGQTYHAGGFISHAGSLWYCDSTTKKKPGSGPDDGFILCVKRGTFTP
jgi:hypothetical protein